MNRFIITNVTHTTEQDKYTTDPYMNRFSASMSHQSFEITLKPMDVNEHTLFKLENIAIAGRTLSLQDTEYSDFMEPFKYEFIEFMIDKHPDKLLSDPKAWDRLRGKS